MKTLKCYPATCGECGYKGTMEEDMTWVSERYEWVCDACLDTGIPEDVRHMVSADGE